MRSAMLFGALCVALPAGALAGPAPIIGGEIDTGDPAVVMLAAYSQDRSELFTCTAVVITPTHLLTAAHCTDHLNFSFGVFFGADASAFPTAALLEPQLSPVSRLFAFPGYDKAPPFTGDIAIVELASPTSVTPLPFSRTAPTQALVGREVRIVGYGQTTFGTPNATKYAGTTVIAGLDPDDTILIGDDVRTCIGDSGGPALLDGVIIGVNSYSDTTGCADPAHFRRTDAYLAFIDQHAGTGPDDDADPSPDDKDDPPADEGGCSTGHPSLLAALGLVLLRRRRR